MLACQGHSDAAERDISGEQVAAVIRDGSSHHWVPASRSATLEAALKDVVSRHSRHGDWYVEHRARQSEGVWEIQISRGKVSHTLRLERVCNVGRASLNTPRGFRRRLVVCRLTPARHAPDVRAIACTTAPPPAVPVDAAAREAGQRHDHHWRVPRRV